MIFEEVLIAVKPQNEIVSQIQVSQLKRRRSFFFGHTPFILGSIYGTSKHASKTFAS